MKPNGWPHGQGQASGEFCVVLLELLQLDVDVPMLMAKE